LGANGGTIVVPMVLTSGDPLPGIGSSFNVNLTISPFTAYFADPNPYEWRNIPAFNGPLGDPVLGVLYPEQIYEELPASNTNILPEVINGVSWVANLAGWYQQALSEGYIQYLGEFTITVGSLPSTPDGYVLNNGQTGILYVNWYHLNYYEQTLEPNAGFYANVGEFATNFGQAHTFLFTGFNGGNPDALIPPDYLPAWMAYLQASWDVIPEPSASLLLILGGAALARRRRQRLE